MLIPTMTLWRLLLPIIIAVRLNLQVHAVDAYVVVIQPFHGRGGYMVLPIDVPSGDALAADFTANGRIYGSAAVASVYADHAIFIWRSRFKKQFALWQKQQRFHG